MMYAFRAVSSLRTRTNIKYIASLTQKRFLKLESIPAVMHVKPQTFEEKNADLNRPLSPHLSIYKYQITSILSISHRATGIALVGYCLLFGLACRIYSVPELIEMIKSLELSNVQWLACKTALVFPYSYHLFNGFRHLVWDAGYGLSLKSVYVTGYAVLILSFLGSIWFVTQYQ